MDRKKISNPLQVGYVRRYTLTEGKENGLKVVELCNSTLRVLLNESKALDIMQVWHRGVNMSFVSKNGFTARETPFLNRFEGGMLYSCGLDSIGGREGYTLHGTFHNNPAKVVEILQKEDCLQVKAVTEVTSLFGENLEMERTVTLRDGKLKLEDALVNRGTREENYCLLYHINLGYPMLDAGTEVVVDAASIQPRTPHSAANMDAREIFPAPMDNEEERCYLIENNTNFVTALNRKLGRKLTLSYSKDTLPCFLQWSSPASQDYALGLEPATSFLDDQFAYRQIAPEERKAFFVELSFEDI
jgi:galactose mutarotase-like enzyme